MLYCINDNFTIAIKDSHLYLADRFFYKLVGLLEFKSIIIVYELISLPLVYVGSLAESSP